MPLRNAFWPSEIFHSFTPEHLPITFWGPDAICVTNSKRPNLFCGKRHPYLEGSLGIIKEGAYADLLIVDVNPLEDVSILGDSGKNLSLIMKDGVIYKNTLK